MRLRFLACLVVLSIPLTATAAVDLLPYLNAPSRVRAGTVEQWYIGVTSNAGQSDWRFEFPLPPNTSFVSMTSWVSAPGSCRSIPDPGAIAGIVDCSGPSLNSIETEALFVVNLMVSPALTAGQTIHSSLTILTTEGKPTNNAAAADTLVVTLADAICAVSLGHYSAGPAYPGDVVELTFVTANNGPDNANDVVMDVTIPPGVTVKGEEWSNGSCTTSPPFRCTAASLPEWDPAGNPLLLTLNLYVTAPSPGVYPYGCSATWSNPNEYSVPQTGSNTLVVPDPEPSADLSVTVEAAPASVTDGDLVTFTIHVTNGGELPALNVTLQQSSSGAVSFSSSSAHCSGAGDASCLLGALASGASTTVTVTDRVTEPGTLTSVFTVAALAEAHTSNNTAAATVEVSPASSRRRAARH